MDEKPGDTNRVHLIHKENLFSKFSFYKIRNLFSKKKIMFFFEFSICG